MSYPICFFFMGTHLELRLQREEFLLAALRASAAARRIPAGALALERTVVPRLLHRLVSTLHVRFVFRLPLQAWDNRFAAGLFLALHPRRGQTADGRRPKNTVHRRVADRAHQLPDR
jgi:hypothetical protein